MHDATALEKRGIPTTVVVHDNFERAARTQARTMGLADLPLAVMPRPQVTWDEDRRRAVVAVLYETVKAGLLARVPVGSGAR